jgi:pantothenate synthetase
VAEGEEVQGTGDTEQAGSSSNSSRNSSNSADSRATASMLLAKASAASAAADARAAQYQADTQQLYQHIKRKMDMATASVLHVRPCCIQGIGRTAGTRCCAFAPHAAQADQAHA